MECYRFANRRVCYRSLMPPSLKLQLLIQCVLSVFIFQQSVVLLSCVYGCPLKL